jgi:hypothetical protein
MRLRAWRFVSLVLAALGAAACTRNPYVIGSICPAAGVDAGVAADPRCGTPPPLAGGTLTVGLGTSGAMALGPLVLPGDAIEPALRLLGERATATAWPTDGAASLGPGTGAPAPGLEAPFNDVTGAVGLAADAPSYVAPDGMLGAVGADDFALEVVLRAAPGASVLSKQAGGIGWSLRTTASGVIELDLGDGEATHAASIMSKPPGLTAGAWYHCLFWVSRAAGGRADCDGSAGPLTAPMPALGTLDAPLAILAAGGASAIRVAHVALFRVAAGGLGDPSGWLAESARRFAILTGAYPQFAKGTALPAAGLRGSVAYVDLQEGPGLPRRLFLVGEDWPRVACRTDVDGMYACGYLSEPRRARNAPADPSAWQPTAVTVAASATLFPDGEPRFSALTPSNAMTTHTLSVAATAGAQNQVFSFFVHRLTAARVGASAGTFGTAVFDLAMGSAMRPNPNVTATIEAWGPDIWRCSYAVGGAVGPQTYTVRLLDDAANATFAGAGAPTLEIGGLQVDDGLGFAGSLLAVDPQLADHLTFVANDGNLPSGTSGRVNLSVLLPAGNRVNDQAILNLNRGGSYDDQVQLYVVGPSDDGGNVKFWRLENRDTYWSFDGALPVIDGRIHDMQASWDVASAHLVISTKSAQMTPLMSNAQPLGLDRIDVGFSQASSGALEGLVAGLQIGAM